MKVRKEKKKEEKRKKKESKESKERKISIKKKKQQPRREFTIEKYHHTWSVSSMRKMNVPCFLRANK
jgi:hypothetical protein